MPDNSENDTLDGTCKSPWSLRALAPLLLATGSSMLLGYLLGRSSYRADLVQAIRTVEQSPVPVEVRIREAL